MAADQKKLSTTGKKVVQLINQTVTGIYEDALKRNNEVWFSNQDQIKPVDSLILHSNMAKEANTIATQMQSSLTQDDKDFINQYIIDLPREIANNYAKLIDNQGAKIGMTPDYKYDADPYTERVGTSRTGILTTPTYATFMEGRRLNKNISGYAGTNNTYSMCDIVCSIDIETNSGEHVYAVLGKLQTLSYSIYQQKQPVRVLGNMNAKDYVYGQRTIAGSLVFAVFNRHWLVDIYDELVNKGIMKNWHYVADELPPFNITVSFANEYGYDSKMALYGVRLMTEGQVMSINDIYIENTYQFVAMDIEYMDALNAWQTTNKINRRWTNTKAAGIIQSNADAKLSAAKKAEAEAAAAAKKKMVGKNVSNEKTNDQNNQRNDKQEDLNKSIEAAEKELERIETINGPESEEATKARNKLENLKEQLNSSSGATLNQQPLVKNNGSIAKSLDKNVEEDIALFDDLSEEDNSVAPQSGDSVEKDIELFDDRSEEDNSNWEEYANQYDQEQKELEEWKKNPIVNLSNEETNKTSKFDKQLELMKEFDRVNAEIDEQVENGEITSEQGNEKREALRQEYEREQQFINEYFEILPSDEKPILTIPVGDPTINTLSDQQIASFNKRNEIKEEIEQKKYEEEKLLPEQECEARAEARQRSLDNQYFMAMHKIQDNYPEKIDGSIGIADIDKATKETKQALIQLKGRTALPNAIEYAEGLEKQKQECTQKIDTAHDNLNNATESFQAFTDEVTVTTEGFNERAQERETEWESLSDEDFAGIQEKVDKARKLNSDYVQDIQTSSEQLKAIKEYEDYQINSYLEDLDKIQKEPWRDPYIWKTYYAPGFQALTDNSIINQQVEQDTKDSTAAHQIEEQNIALINMINNSDNIGEAIAEAKLINADIDQIYFNWKQQQNNLASLWQTKTAEAAEALIVPEDEAAGWNEHVKECNDMLNSQGTMLRDYNEEIANTINNLRMSEDSLSVADFKRYEEAEMKRLAEEGAAYAAAWPSVEKQAKNTISQNIFDKLAGTYHYLTDINGDYQRTVDAAITRGESQKLYDQIAEQHYSEYFGDGNIGDDDVFDYFHITIDDIKTMTPEQLQQRAVSQYDYYKDAMRTATTEAYDISNPDVAQAALNAIYQDESALDRQYKNVINRIALYQSDTDIYSPQTNDVKSYYTYATESDIQPDYSSFDSVEEALNFAADQYVQNRNKNTSDNLSAIQNNARSQQQKQERISIEDDAGNYEVLDPGIIFVNAFRDMESLKYPLDNTANDRFVGKNSVESDPNWEHTKWWGGTTEGTNCTRAPSIALQGTPYEYMNYIPQVVNKAKEQGDYYEPVGYEPVIDPDTGVTKVIDGVPIWDYVKDSAGNILYNKKDSNDNVIASNITYQKKPGDLAILPNDEDFDGHIVMFNEKGGYIHCGGEVRTVEEVNTDPLYKNKGYVNILGGTNKDRNGQVINRPVYCIISTSKYAEDYIHDRKKSEEKYPNVGNWKAIAEAQQRAGNKIGNK